MLRIKIVRSWCAIVGLFFSIASCMNESRNERQNASNKQIGQVADVDFYIEGFSQNATQVTLIAGREYRVRSIVGNVCDEREYLWNLWGGTPTSPSDEHPLVKFNTVGTFPMELTLRTRHVGGGSVCSSDGYKKKEYYVRVVR